MLDAPTKERFVELRAQGWSFSRIADELKVSKPTLIALSKELEFEISNLKAVELEVLHEKHFVQKAKRIELFGTMLGTIKGELEKRNLTEIPTEKLFDLLIKYAAVLKQEESVTLFQRVGSFDMSDPFSQVQTWSA